MSGIVGSRFNIKGSGLVGSLGTDGQVFTSSGAGAGAIYEDAGGGDVVKLSQQIVTSAVTTINFVDGTDGADFSSTYKYHLMLVDAEPTGSSGQLGCFRLSTDTGSNWLATGYTGESFRSYYSGGTSRSATTDFIIKYESNVADDADNRCCLATYFWKMVDGTVVTAASGAGVGTQSPVQVNSAYGAGIHRTIAAHDGIQFLFDSGDVEEANVTLYGFK